MLIRLLELQMKMIIFKGNDVDCDNLINTYAFFI